MVRHSSAATAAPASAHKFGPTASRRPRRDLNFLRGCSVLNTPLVAITGPSLPIGRTLCKHVVPLGRSAMRFQIPNDLLVHLRARRANRDPDAIEAEHDAFLLFPGMGCPLYLTTDGRILKDGREWEGTEVREGDDNDAVAALVIGAENWNMRDLLKLLPPPPESSAACTLCGGSRWWHFKDYFGKPSKILCSTCGGRGWLTSSTPAA